VPTTDPAIRKAAAFLRAHQRADGAWGEAHVAKPSSTYVDEAEGQVTQTAWALSALLEAGEPDWEVLERAARFLASAQLSSGEWPKQKPAGVFFHTALLDYTLYRAYFPVWALAEFEHRRLRRGALLGAKADAAHVTRLPAPHPPTTA
jgi:lanosterol synthase